MLGARRCFLAAGGRALGRSCPRPLHTSRSVCSAQEVTSQDGGSLDEAYSPQQRALILRLLNSASRSQLECVRELQGKKAANLTKYRAEYGPFPDLNTLRHVPHLPATSLRQACDALLTLSTNTQQRAAFLTPNISLSKLQAAESIVSIVFGLKKMAWAHVDRTVTVRDWQEQQCFNLIKGKHQPEIYLEDMVSVVSRLPAADFYILEKPFISTQNVSLFPALLHLRTVEAMLYCLLNPQIRDGGHRVFSMARHTVGKHFDIMLGEMRTSGVEVVERLMEEATVAFTPRLNVPPAILQQYRQQFQARGQSRHEELCDALLQALTFYHLLLFQ